MIWWHAGNGGCAGSAFPGDDSRVDIAEPGQGRQDGPFFDVLLQLFVYLQIVPEGKITEVVFAAGLGLWETPVSLSVEAGVSVSGTVRQILSASGTGIPLLSFPGEDPVRSRGQAFYGRAAECIEEALMAAGARGYLTESGLCVVPAEGLPVSMDLSSADLLSDPVFVGNRQMLLRTRITGWPLGKGVRVKWKDGSQEGLVLERSVEADNLEGKWESEMLIEKRNG